MKAEKIREKIKHRLTHNTTHNAQTVPENCVRPPSSECREPFERERTEKSLSHTILWHRLCALCVVLCVRDGVLETVFYLKTNGPI